MVTTRIGRLRIIATWSSTQFGKTCTVCENKALERYLVMTDRGKPINKKQNVSRWGGALPKGCAKLKGTHKYEALQKPRKKAKK